LRAADLIGSRVMKTLRGLLSVWVVILFCASLGTAGCSSEGNGNGNGDGNGNTDGNGQLDGNGSDGSGADVPICDEVELEASPLANLLLVVDKSHSMNDPTEASGDRTKVEDLRTAVHFMLDAFEGKIRFGWMPFPNQDTCDPGVVLVEVGDDSAGLIRQLVDAFVAWGGTPTGETLQNALACDGLADEERSNFVLLVTDGMPTCPAGSGHSAKPADAQLALSAVDELHAAGIGTFVVGLGEDFNSSDPQLLNDMAVAGGQPRDDSVKYYPASSLAELEAAFEDIAKAVFDCSLALEVVPEKPEWIWVYFDGEPVDRDGGHQDGFDYDEQNNRIDFYGPACDRLANGEVEEIYVEMGCMPPT